MCSMQPWRSSSKITNVLQDLISAAEQNGISDGRADLEKQHIMSRPLSPDNSPVWPVQMPDGRWHLTIDYWHRNANTVPPKAAVPTVATLTATLQAAAHPWMAVPDVRDVFTPLLILPACLS